MRAVATVIHVDDVYPGIGGEIARGLSQCAACPHCGSNLKLADCRDIRPLFSKRMARYIFAGIPTLESRRVFPQTP